MGALDLGGKVPVVVGITGHRDLFVADEEALVAHVRARLEHLREHLPSTPIVVLTGLAEGADRVGARAALELRDGVPYDREGRPAGTPRADRAPVRVVGILASPRARFERSLRCQSADALDAFLSACDAWHELPALEGRDDWPDATEAARDAEGYRHLAAHVAHAAHVLVALSEEPCPPRASAIPAGGTATVMSWFAHGPPGSSALDPTPAALGALEHPERSALAWIPVRRRGTSAPCDAAPRGAPPDVPAWRLFGAGRPAETGAAHWAHFALQSVRAFLGHEEAAPDESEPRRYLARIDRFDRDCDELLPAVRDEDVRGPLPGAGGDDLEPWASTYVAADLLSSRALRPRFGLWVRRATTLALLAVLCFEAYVHILHGIGFLLVLWFGLLAALVAVAVRLRHDLLDERDQVYRSLAEAVRVQAAWRLGGLAGNAGDDYSRHLQNEVAWVRSSLRALAACAGPPAARDARARVEDVLASWVRPQREYFRRTIARSRHDEHYWHEWFLFALAAGLVLTLLAALPDHGPQHQLIGFATVALAAAGLVHAEAARRAARPLVRRYENQDPVFERAEARLEEIAARDTLGPDDLEEAQAAIRDLGLAALHENTSWLLTRRNRPLEIHFH